MQICEPGSCIGCGLCVMACPVRCIGLVENQEGFDAPVVDDSACIQCGRCRAVCPAANEVDRPAVRRPLAAFGAWAGDPAIRDSSSSGGVFPVLAAHVLHLKGCVAGAVYAADFQGVEHVVVDGPEQLDRLRKSKYVQSRLAGLWAQLDRAVHSAQPFLFSGTPCQVLAFKRRYGDVESVATVEVICHGVLSPALFRAYIAWLRNRLGNLDGYEMRSKCMGWRAAATRYRGDGRRECCLAPARDPFRSLYSRALGMRPCCHTCRYTGFPRIADVTLGDFWGVERLFPGRNDNRGVSAVLANTAKGLALVQSCLPSLEWWHADTDQIVAGNPNLVMATPAPPLREAFFETFRSRDFGRLRRYFSPKRRGLLHVARAAARRLREGAGSWLLDDLWVPEKR